MSDTIPLTCQHCGSPKLKDHCLNAQCTWLRCDACARIMRVQDIPRPRETPE